MTEKINLTEFSKGGGCGCKIGPDDLQKILSNLSTGIHSEKLIVGNKTNDDAAVYNLGNDYCLISTTDFFTAIVDSPFEFGKIAATNALSDVYSMGGKPILALAVLGYPSEKIKPETISEIMNGATGVCNQINIPIAGGHTIESADLFFGLSVNGLVELKHLKRNNTAKTGDYIFLTKPLGAGILSAALKRKQITEDDYAKLLASMLQLNSIGEILSKEESVNAMTDVTGFGLLGHLSEVCNGSNVSAEINFSKIQFLTNLEQYLDKFIYPDITTKNYAAISAHVTDLDAKQLFTLCDPQTSGGLLICVNEDGKEKISSLLKLNGIAEELCEPIGRVISRSEKLIYVL
ncbi:MAG TPA: selenide, water dikinase SelD [Bacteroidia bacterium]|nr:selenide, water dikinase SelD [Bacteroidia bacterium]HNU34628.1 selenide, water dikinase SelD [Bacteroidia bacterium]